MSVYFKLLSSVVLAALVASGNAAKLRSVTEPMTGLLMSNNEEDPHKQLLVPSLVRSISSENEQRLALLDINKQLDFSTITSNINPPCTVTELDVNFFQQRIQTEAQKAAVAMTAELKKNKIELAKSTVASLKDAALKHVVSGGALNQEALKTVVGTTLKGNAKDLAANSLTTGLKAMDLSVDFCLFKKIAGKDIYFQGRLSGDVKTKKLSGALTLLTRIDVGYLHLAQATVTVKDINPKDIKNVNVEIKGEFCCGFVTDCEKAQYKGFGRAQSKKQDADVPSSVSDAKGKTFTGIITITHKADGTNSIAIKTGSGGLTLGKLFYVNVGAAVDADRAQKIVNFMGDFAAVGVEKMGLEWKKTKATFKNNATTPGKVTKRLFAKPSFGDVTKYTCDVSDDRFTASGVSVGVLFLVSLLQYKEARLFSVVVVFLVYAKNPCTWYIFSASHNICLTPTFQSLCFSFFPSILILFSFMFLCHSMILALCCSLFVCCSSFSSAL